jgi:hypothetical protein
LSFAANTQHGLSSFNVGASSSDSRGSRLFFCPSVPSRQASGSSTTLAGPPPKLGYFDQNDDVDTFAERVSEYSR